MKTKHHNIPDVFEFSPTIVITITIIIVFYNCLICKLYKILVLKIVLSFIENYYMLGLFNTMSYKYMNSLNICIY